MQFPNQHTSKCQKRSKHFVCTRLPGSSMFCIGWHLATRLLDESFLNHSSRVAQGAYLEVEYIRNVLSVSGTLKYADSGTA